MLYRTNKINLQINLSQREEDEVSLIQKNSSYNFARDLLLKIPIILCILQISQSLAERVPASKLKQLIVIGVVYSVLFN